MNQFISTLEIMTAMKTFIAALELAEGVKLFQVVEFYKEPDLIKALEDLQKMQDRVCLIIPSGDDFQNKFEGNQFATDAVRSFELLIASRSIIDPTKALTADDGLIALKDLLTENLHGQSLGLSPRRVALRPDGGQAISIPKNKNQSGRLLWQMTWLANAGEKLAQLRK